MKTNERPDILSAQLTDKQLRRIKAREAVDQLIKSGATISLVMIARRDYIKATAAVARAQHPIERNVPMNAEAVTIQDLVPGSINFEVEFATVVPRCDMGIVISR